MQCSKVPIRPISLNRKLRLNFWVRFDDLGRGLPSLWPASGAWQAAQVGLREGQAHRT